MYSLPKSGLQRGIRSPLFPVSAIEKVNIYLQKASDEMSFGTLEIRLFWDHLEDFGAQQIWRKILGKIPLIQSVVRPKTESLSKWFQRNLQESFKRW